MKTNRVAYFPLPTAAIAFRPEFLDFRRGIHVGNLEENERITRILKLALEARYGQGFVTERWGRGVFWQWIAFLPRADRDAKPLSSHVSFGCSKFFISVETEEKVFKCGMQVERGYVKAPPDSAVCELRSDWDWHRLMKGLRTGSPMERELRRLIFREGFRLFAGSWEAGYRAIFSGRFSRSHQAAPLAGCRAQESVGGISALLPHDRRGSTQRYGRRPGGIHARRLQRGHAR